MRQHNYSQGNIGFGRQFMAIFMTRMIAARAHNVPGENTLRAAVDDDGPPFHRPRGPISTLGAGPDWEF